MLLLYVKRILVLYFKLLLYLKYPVRKASNQLRNEYAQEFLL